MDTIHGRKKDTKKKKKEKKKSTKHLSVSIPHSSKGKHLKSFTDAENNQRMVQD